MHTRGGDCRNHVTRITYNTDLIGTDETNQSESSRAKPLSNPHDEHETREGEGEGDTPGGREDRRRHSNRRTIESHM